MRMNLGESIAVLRPIKTGVDEMGDPVVRWEVETVANAIVRPTSPDEVDAADRINGVRISYTIALPKSYTSSLRHCRIALIDRGMNITDANAALRVTNDPDQVHPCPTAWNRLAYVGRVDG